MGVKLGRSHWGWNVGWGSLRIGCWGEYLGLRGTRWQWSWENYITRSLLICTANPIFFGWSNRDEWDGLGLKHVWGRGEAYTGVWWWNLRERDHLEDAGVDGRIILRWIFKKSYGGMDWIELAQDRDRGRVLMNSVRNTRFPQNAGDFLSSWESVSFSRRTVLHGVRSSVCPKYLNFSTISKYLLLHFTWRFAVRYISLMSTFA